MLSPTHKTALLTLLCLAAACGDPGEPLDPQASLDGELAPGEGFGVDPDAGLPDEESVFDQAADPSDDGTPARDELPGVVVVEELTEQELAIIGGLDEPEQEVLIEGILDGAIDLDGLQPGSTIIVDGLSEEEMAALEAAGFVVEVRAPSQVPGDQIAEAVISIELARVTLDGSDGSSSVGCSAGLLLDIEAGVISQAGECGFVDYELTVTFRSDGGVSGVIRLESRNATARIDLVGDLVDGLLTLTFDHDLLFPPRFHDFWDGKLVAGLR